MAGVVILAGDGQSTWVIANALAKVHTEATVVIEQREPASTFIRRRLRKFGLFQTLGQVLFILWSRRATRKRAQRRADILANAGQSDAPWCERVYRVSNANGAEAVALLRSLRPEVVVVNGTRILKGRVLTSLDCPFINTHLGITPSYRGVHGGYWALAYGDINNFGATVHLVDAGVDTGDVIDQVRCRPSPEDDFSTYPIVQVQAAVASIINAVSAAREGKLRTHRAEGSSRQWYHPTIWGYFWRGWRRGVW